MFNFLRIFLALEVVVAHIIPVLYQGIYWPGFLMAVPAFLAVSGFLVLGSYANNPQIIPFLIKRSLRIFPGLIASIFLCWLILGPEYATSSVRMFLTGGLGVTEGNRPLWSLIWELLAYIILIILWLLGAYQSKVALTLLLAISIGLSYYICAENYHPTYQILSFLPVSFLIGNIFFLLRNVTKKIHFGYSVCFFIFVVIFFSSPYRETLVAPLPVILQAIAVVWLGSSDIPVAKKQFPDISYGLYIYHYPILIWFSHKSHLMNSMQTLLALAIILPSVSLISWYFIEKPALNIKKRISGKQIPSSP